jgi:hypothetical protein
MRLDDAAKRNPRHFDFIICLGDDVLRPYQRKMFSGGEGGADKIGRPPFWSFFNVRKREREQLHLPANIVGLSMVRLEERLEVSLSSLLHQYQLLPFTKNHGDSFAVINAVVIVPGSFLSREHLHQHSPLSHLLPFSLLPLVSAMKFAFEIKNEPLTQATSITAIVSCSSGCLASIVIYSQSPLVSVFCSVVLAVIIYLALQLAPR